MTSNKDEPPLQLSEIPAWLATLTPTEPAVKAAPDAATHDGSEAKAEEAQAKVEVEAQAEAVRVQSETQFSETPQQSDDAFETIANGLIAFKRFWSWPSGTANELTACRELAQYIVDTVKKYADKPE